MDYASTMLCIRLAIHVMTVLVILKYSAEDGARYKPGVSISAFILAGSSAALAMQILTRWDTLVYSEPMPALPVFCGAILWRLWRVDGNVASFFSRKGKRNVPGAKVT